jgi:hypothetical protein
VVLAELAEFRLGESAFSRLSKSFDVVGGEETTVDTSILLEIAKNFRKLIAAKKSSYSYNASKTVRVYA